MVHALSEARRVLKPNGVLIDLRPAAVHRRVGVVQAGQYHLLGVMRERLDDDYAANRAVADVVRRQFFKPERRVRFECNRTMDRVAEFRGWLNDFVSLGKLAPHDWLMRRVERACRESDVKTKIVVTGPLDLRVLRKQER